MGKKIWMILVITFTAPAIGVGCQFDHNLILAQRRINTLPPFFEHDVALT
jgi:hypothetical protein